MTESLEPRGLLNHEDRQDKPAARNDKRMTKIMILQYALYLIRYSYRQEQHVNRVNLANMTNTESN